mmetsp:Transcript_17252/g.19228  ORF Transcript_17252/g.19228 Transcript_17252/m.19228 type:complete len:494 (-) Transcript_17252:83-1564(-)
MSTRNRISRKRTRQTTNLTDSGSSPPPSKKQRRTKTKSKRLKKVTRDADGRAILPFKAKGATIHCLGTVVCERPKFHTKNYIWPVGFKSTRKMPSIKDSKEYVTYVSEIVDLNTAPGFKVYPEDCPELGNKVYGTASRAWMEILKKIKKKDTISVSGPGMFGFSDSRVRMLFQELPGAEHCTTYTWVQYEGSPSREDKLSCAANLQTSTSMSQDCPMSETDDEEHSEDEMEIMSPKPQKTTRASTRRHFSSGKHPKTHQNEKSPNVKRKILLTKPLTAQQLRQAKKDTNNSLCIVIKNERSVDEKVNGSVNLTARLAETANTCTSKQRKSGKRLVKPKNEISQWPTTSLNPTTNTKANARKFNPVQKSTQIKNQSGTTFQLVPDNTKTKVITLHTNPFKRSLAVNGENNENRPQQQVQVDQTIKTLSPRGQPPLTPFQAADAQFFSKIQVQPSDTFFSPNFHQHHTSLSSWKSLGRSDDASYTMPLEPLFGQF